MKVTMYSKRSEWLVNLKNALVIAALFLAFGIILSLLIGESVDVTSTPECATETRITSPFCIRVKETTADSIEDEEEICIVPSLLSELIVTPEETVEIETEMVEEAIAVETEALEDTEVEVVINRTYDIPLDGELQSYIISVSDKYGVDPELIFAIIDVESKYTVDVIGDNGNAFGLMQIQPRWHSDRMYRLGVSSAEELLDPHNNVLVGIDFVAELIGYGRGVDWALMAYNGGPGNANARTSKVVNYYNKVMGTYEKLS